MQNPENHFLLPTSTLTGLVVKNLGGETLGNIKDMLVDTTNGQIIYAVLSLKTGLLGMQNKYFAIPWRAFQFDTAFRDTIVLDVSQEKLKNSPGFEEHHWPVAPQKEFINDMYTHYGYDPYYFITE